MNQRKSRSLQNRLNNLESRLHAMSTVTNTSSAEISGGETVIDEDGSLYFMDGGTLYLGSSSVKTSDSRDLIDSSGNLYVDSLTVYGDILSSRDYVYQREPIDEVIVDTSEVASKSLVFDIEFPDWASTALVTFSFRISTRIESVNSNKLLITLNGKPVARPRSNDLGDIELSSSVIRRIYPENLSTRISVELDEESVPSSTPRMLITLGGVFTV